MAHLLFFGHFSDIAKNGEVTLPSDVSNTDQLIVWLSETYDLFTALWNKPGTSIILNNEIVSTTKTIKNSDEIAILSALSGG